MTQSSRDLISSILSASNEISKLGRSSSANYILVSPLFVYGKSFLVLKSHRRMESIQKILNS